MSKPIYTRLQMLFGTKIALHFSLPLATNTNIDKNDFQLFLGGVSKTIDSVLTNAGYLIIDHSETITNPKLIRVSYTKNADSSKNIAASATNGGGVVDSFSAVDNIPPRVVQQTISSSSTIDLIFDDYIVDNANIDSADFDFKLDNVSKSISSISTTSGRVVITHGETISNIEQVDITYTKNATSSKNIVDEAGNAAENFSSFGQSNEFNENYITNEASQWHFITFNRNKGTSSDELNSGNFVYNTEGSTADTNFGHKFIVGYKEAGMSSGIIVGNSYLKTNINDYGAFILDNGSSINPVKIENGNNIMVGAGSYTTNGSKMVKNPHFRFAFNPMTYKYAWYYASMWVQPSYSDNTNINNLRDNHLFQQLCCGTYIPGEADLFKLWGDSTYDLYTSLNTGLTRSGTETHKSLDEQYSKKISASFASHNGFKPISYYDDLDLRSWVYHAYNGSWDGKTLVFSTHKTGDTAAGYNGVNQKKVLIADFDGTQNIFNINYTTFIEEQSLYMGTGTNHITVKDDWMAIYWKGSGASHTRIYKKTNGTWNATHHSFVAGSQPKLYKTKTGEYYLLTGSSRHYYNSNTDSWDSHSEMTVSGSMESDKNGFIPKRIITNSSSRKIYVWSDVNETYNEVDILGYTNSDAWRSAAADDSPGFGLRVAIWNGNKYNSGTNVNDNITVMKYENGKFVNEENGLIRLPTDTVNLYGDNIYFKKNTIVYRSWSKSIRAYKKIKNHWILTNHIMHTPGPYGAMGIHVYNNKMIHFDHETGGYGAGVQYQRVGSVSYLEMSFDYSPEFHNAIVPAVINNVTDTTNTKIGVYFSEDLVKNTHIDKNDFTVSVNGVSAAVSTAEIIEGDVILTMSSAITNGQTVTINYTANSNDMKKLKGYGTKYIKSFSSEAQENVYVTAAKGWGDQTYNTPYGETITDLRTGEGSFHIEEKRKLGSGIVPTNVTCATTNTTVNIISSGGNKYVFNGENSYDSSKKYGLYTNTYIFKDVPSGHPIAILNNGNANIMYTGDDSKKFTKAVSGTTNDGTYDFYYGDVTVTVSGDFGTMSVYCYYHGYMGGENLLKYTTTCEKRIYAPQAAKSVVVSFDITREKFDKIETQSYYEGGSNKFPTGVSMVLKHGDTLYVNSTTKIYKFVETTSTWSTVITNLSSPIDGFIYNNNFYYVTSSLTSIQKFDPTTDTLSTVTISGTPPSLSGYNMVVCQNNNELYCYASNYNKQSFLYKIDLATNSGSQIVYTTNDDNVGYDSAKASTNSYFYGVFNCAIFYHGGNVYLIGGQRRAKKDNDLGSVSVNTLFKINVSDKIISKVNYHGYFHQTAFTNSQPIVINDEVYIWSPGMNSTVWFKMIFDKHTTGVKSVNNNVGLSYKTMTVRTLDQGDSASGTNRVYKTADSIWMYAVGNEESANDEFITQDKIWPAFSWQHSYGSKGAALSTEYKIKDKDGTDKTDVILNQTVTQKYFATFSSSQFKVITPNAGLITDGISIDEIRAFGTGKGWLDGGRTGEMSYVLISTKAHAAMKNAGDQVDVYFRFPKTTKPKYWIKDMYEVVGQDYYYIYMFTAEKVSGTKNFDSWMTWEYQYDILPAEEPVLSNWTPQIENAYVEPGNTYQLILLFDTIIEYPATLDATLFTVKINGTSVSVTNAILHSEIDKKNKITITLGVAPNVGDTMTVSYSKPTDVAKKIGASNTRSIDSFTDVSVRAQTFKYMSKGLNYRYWSFGSSNMANGLFYGLCRAGSYMYVGDDNGYDQYYTGTVGNQNHWPIYRFIQQSNGILHALSFIDFKDKNGNVRNDFIMSPKNLNEISADYIARGGNFGTGFDSSHGSAVYLSVFPNAGGSSGSPGGNKSEGDWNSYTGGSQVVIMWNDPRDIYVYFRAKKTAPAWNNVNSQLKFERPDDSVNYYMLMFQGTFKKYDATNRDVRSIGQMLTTWDGLNSSHSTYTGNGRSGSDDLSQELRNKKAPKNVYDITEYANSRLYSPYTTPWRDLEASDVGYLGMYDENFKKVYNGKIHVIETGHLGVPTKQDTFGPSPKKGYLHNINHSQVMLYFDEYLADGLILNKDNWIIKITDNNGTNNATITEIKYEANFALFKFEEVVVQSDVVSISYTAPTSVSSASVKDNKDNYIANFVDFSVENNLLIPATISKAETFDSGRKIRITMSKNFKSTDYRAFVNPSHFGVNGSYTGSVNVSDVIVYGNTITLLCSGIFVNGEIIKIDYVPHSDYSMALKDDDGTPMTSISGYTITNNSLYDVISEMTCYASSSVGGSLEFGSNLKIEVNKPVDVGVTLEWNGNNDHTSNILYSATTTPWTVGTKVTTKSSRGNFQTYGVYTVQENDYYVPNTTNNSNTKHAFEGTAGYKGHWMQYDMGTQTTVDNLWMLDGYYTNHIYRIKEFVICGSNDFAVTDTTYPFTYTGTWTYVDTVTNVNNLMPDSSRGDTEDPVKISFNSATYRYWRVVVTKLSTNHSLEFWFCSLPISVTPVLTIKTKNAIDNVKHRASGNVVTIDGETINYITDDMIPYTGWNVNDAQIRCIYAEEKGPYNLAAMYGIRYYMGLSFAGYAASSIYNGNYAQHKAFDNQIDNLYEWNYEYQHFMCGNSKYSSGNYSGTEKTGTNDYEGEWLQVDLIESYKVDSIVIHPRGGPSKTTGLPKDFKIFGSNDGSTWTEVLDISGLTSGDWNLNNGSGYTSHNSIGPYTLTNQTWRYWRLVVNKTINGAYFAIGQFMLLGNMNTAYRKHLFSYYNVVQNKWLKLGKVEQTAYIINNGTISHSSTSSYPENLPNPALVADDEDGDFRYPWANTGNQLSGANSTNAGWVAAVVATSSTETTDGYVGEWLQIEDTTKFKVEKVSLLVSGHGGDIKYPTTTWGPKNYRIYGSDDKVSWTQLIDQSDLTHEDWIDVNGAAYGRAAPIIHIFNPIVEYKVYRIVVNSTIGGGSGKAHISRVRFYTPVDKTNDTFQNFIQSNYNSPQTGGGEINASSITHNLNSSVSKLLTVLPLYKKMILKPKNWTIGQDPTTPANMDGITVGSHSLYLRFSHATSDELPRLISSTTNAEGSFLSDSNVFNSKYKDNTHSYPYNGTRQAFKQSRSNMNLYYDKEIVFYFWAGDADAAENKYHILFGKKNTQTAQPDYYEWMNYSISPITYPLMPFYRGFPVKSISTTEVKEFNELLIGSETIGANPVYGNIKGRQPAWRYIGEFSTGWKNQDWLMITGKDAHIVGFNDANEQIFDSDSTDTWDRTRKSEIQTFEALPTLADPSIPQRPSVSKAALNVPNKVLITFTTNVVIGTPTLTDFRVKLNGKLLSLTNVILTSGKIEITFQQSVIPHTDAFPQVVTISYIQSEIIDQQIGALLPVNTFTDTAVTNNLGIEAVNEVVATAENAGITAAEVTTRTETLVPANTTRSSSGKYEFTNIAQSIAIVADDTPAKKRLRTKKFIKSIFTRIQTLDNTIDTKTEGIKINREILAFTEIAKKKVKAIVRAFDVDSTIDTSSIPEDESVYVPLEDGQACTLVINSVSHRFIKQSTGTLVSPQINNKSLFNEGDIEVTGGMSIVFGSVSVQSEPAVIHIPVIFDLSGNMETFVSGDRWNPLYSHRHRFDCGGLGVANVTANLFKNAFSMIQQRYDFTVTVVNDNGQNKFAFDGVIHDQLLLTLAQTYKFKPSPTDLFTNHPLRFSVTSDGTHNGGIQYNTGVTTTNTGDIMLSLPSSLNNTTNLYTNDASNAKIYYYCGSHSNMGNFFDVSDQQAIFTRNSDASCNALRDSFIQQLTTEGVSDIVHDISWSDIYTPEDTVDQGNTINGYVKTRNNVDYTNKITSTAGNSVGEILLRYMSTHLTGHPLGQSFIKNDSAFINQINGSGNNTANIANVLVEQMKLGLSENGTVGRGNYVLDTLFKQLKKQDPGRCGLSDTKKDFPLLAGDKVIIYISAKINVAADISKSVDSANVAIAMTNEVFPNSKYPYMVDATGVLDAGTWMITLTIS